LERLRAMAVRLPQTAAAKWAQESAQAKVTYPYSLEPRKNSKKKKKNEPLKKKRSYGCRTRSVADHRSGKRIETAAAFCFVSSAERGRWS
jgi:hypothetical protein